MGPESADDSRGSGGRGRAKGSQSRSPLRSGFARLDGVSSREAHGPWRTSPAPRRAPPAAFRPPARSLRLRAQAPSPSLDPLLVHACLPLVRLLPSCGPGTLGTWGTQSSLSQQLERGSPPLPGSRAGAASRAPAASQPCQTRACPPPVRPWAIAAPSCLSFSLQNGGSNTLQLRGLLGGGTEMACGSLHRHPSGLCRCWPSVSRSSPL